MKGGAVNDRVQLLASRTGIPYVGERKVRAHSLRAARTPMIAAKVPLRERNPSGRWAGSPNTADTVYGWTPFSPEADPLPQVPAGRLRRIVQHGGPLLGARRVQGQRVARIITVSTGDAGDGWLCPMSSYPHDR